MSIFKSIYDIRWNNKNLAALGMTSFFVFFLFLYKQQQPISAGAFLSYGDERPGGRYENFWFDIILITLWLFFFNMKLFFLLRNKTHDKYRTFNFFYYYYIFTQSNLNCLITTMKGQRFPPQKKQISYILINFRPDHKG